MAIRILPVGDILIANDLFNLCSGVTGVHVQIVPKDLESLKCNGADVVDLRRDVLGRCELQIYLHQFMRAGLIVEVAMIGASREHIGQQAYSAISPVGSVDTYNASIVWLAWLST